METANTSLGTKKFCQDLENLSRFFLSSNKKNQIKNKTDFKLCSAHKIPTQRLKGPASVFSLRARRVCI